MMELINSDILKLISILLALIAIFYIGVKNKPISGNDKSYHLWYICGMAAFIVIELVTYIIVGNVEAVSIMNYISFASTLASLILSVLAIFMTVLSGESMNKLRDGMIRLGDVPTKVEEALKSTINGMQQSTNELNLATKKSNENMKTLNDFIDLKIKEIENHILNKLELHQKTTLKAINDSILDKKDNPSKDVYELSDSIIQNFLAGTSNASISLFYMIDLYCKKVKESDGKQPIANLIDLSTAINGGKKDERFGMYLFACLVFGSSFGLLDYETTEDLASEVKFNSINSTLVSYLPHQLEVRGINVVLEGLKQYIDSLFNDEIQEEHKDGSENNKD